MQKKLRSSLLSEEQRTVIWFLSLFYTIYIIYDIFYFYILPIYFWNSSPGLPNGGLDIFVFLIMIGLLPVAYYLMNKSRTDLIKYVYFITFTLLNIANEIAFYWGTNLSYSSGNIVEIVIVLFSPIFVNKKFFYLVSLGTMLKFVIVGIVIQDPLVMMPLLVVFVLTLLAYILLHRFISYVEAVKTSYNKQLEGIVKGVIATLELKDPYTRGHSERVAYYANSLAKATGRLGEDELQSFYYTCLLHDIGKVHIPDSILTKPGRLTAEEFEVIKTHPVVGAEAVEKVEGIDDNIDVIYHHHERWDGTGYPDQLKGKEIPFLARVTTIADAFDAMTSSRSYRSALPLEEAYRRIIDGKETQFDPDLVELFNEVYLTWIDYHKKYYSNDKGLIESVPISKEVKLP